MTTIALDCMGGDHGPQEAVAGAAALSIERPDLHTILVGDAAQIGPLLDSMTYDPARLSVRHTPHFVGPEDVPREALAAHPDVSIAEACELVAEGRASAVVTAGSTGAAILAAARRLGRIPGVRRAALAAVTPTEQRHGPHGDPFALLLDVGATLNVSSRDLVTFAIMGSAYAAAISGNDRPRVALLSNGTESHKGPPEVVAAHAVLAELGEIEFAGNVEGLDIPRGSVDVVVTGGFIGNVVLKMLEGIGEVIADLASDAYARKFLWRLGLTMLSSGIKQIEAVMDWESYGGAPILGFCQPVIKAHGRSRSGAIANACKVAAKAARSDMVRTVERAVARLPVPEEEEVGS
ncbi:MAG: phosphate acyltransferase PlsX [Proteobacteria bacterium]|nr:phosphate acyltransferase PlsX [Pseudomonadota bacterium]